NRNDQTSSPVTRSNDQARVPRTDSAPESRRGGDNGNWQKFPGSGDRPSGGDRPPQVDRGGTPPQKPARTQEERGGPQHFPSNTDPGSPRDSSSGRSDRRDSGGSKPPLALDRPTRTPRKRSRD